MENETTADDTTATHDLRRSVAPRTECRRSVAPWTEHRRSVGSRRDRPFKLYPLLAEREDFL